MDGNGRWATQRNRPRLFGHHAGAARVREIVEICPDLGIKYLTVYAFSTENWKRTQSEVSGLMKLFRLYIENETRSLIKNNVKVRFIGDRIRLEPELIALMDRLEKQTVECLGVNLTIALNYGGRDEVARATKRLAWDVSNGRLDPEAINEETLAKYLDTWILPDPDLIIRTSGEARVSNFLLWQSAYSEYEFIATLWPDFSAEEFSRITQKFHNRDRTYGMVNH
jgi:undecaprenyl diphosphate synthase